MDIRGLFERLGLTSGKWQWRALRIENRLQDLAAFFRGKRQQVVYRHKFCTSCRSLMDASDTVCPRCGEKADRWGTQVADRFFTRLLPGGTPATSGLLLANGIVFVLLLLLFGSGSLFRPTTEALTKMGMLFPVTLQDGEHWRFVTHGYLHIGLLHFLFNMFVLSRLGSMMEREIGSTRFFVVYTASLLGGGIAITLLPHPAAGASGALFGCIGFGAAYGHAYGGAAGRQMRNAFLQWILYAYLFGFAMGGVSHAAHTGGLVVGAIAGFLVERERLNRERHNRYWLLAARGCVFLTAVAFLWMILARGGAIR